jgi:hypothetical protein
MANEPSPKEGDIIEIKGTKYLCMGPDLLAEIAYFRNEGGKEIPVLKTQTFTKEEGIDADGNPKRSVEVRVQCVKIGANPGNNG